MGGPYHLQVERKREDSVALVPVCLRTAIAQEEMQLMLKMQSKGEKERKNPSLLALWSLPFTDEPTQKPIDTGVMEVRL